MRKPGARRTTTARRAAASGAAKARPNPGSLHKLRVPRGTKGGDDSQRLVRARVLVRLVYNGSWQEAGSVALFDAAFARAMSGTGWLEPLQPLPTTDRHAPQLAKRKPSSEGDTETGHLVEESPQALRLPQYDDPTEMLDVWLREASAAVWTDDARRTALAAIDSNPRNGPAAKRHERRRLREAAHINRGQQLFAGFVRQALAEGDTRQAAFYGYRLGFLSALAGHSAIGRAARMKLENARRPSGRKGGEKGGRPPLLLTEDVQWMAERYDELATTVRRTAQRGVIEAIAKDWVPYRKQRLQQELQELANGPAPRDAAAGRSRSRAVQAIQRRIAALRPPHPDTVRAALQSAGSIAPRVTRKKA